MSNLHLPDGDQVDVHHGDVSEEPLAPLTRPIFVIGKAQHGKTVFRRALAKALGVRGASCSDVIYVVWSLFSGIGEEMLRVRPKTETRHLLVALGDWLTAPAQTYSKHFPRHLFPDADLGLLERSGFPRPSHAALIRWSWLTDVRVLDGVRRERELDEAHEHFVWAGIDPLVVWVEKPDAAEVAGDNFSISKKRASRFFVNDGSVEDLERQARDFAKEL